MADPRDRFLISLYHKRPDLFSAPEIDRLQSVAKQEGLYFKRDTFTDDKNLSVDVEEIVKQFIGGTVEGATAFIDPFEPPKDVAGDIAHRLGSLAGFTGMIFGTGGLGGFVGGAAEVGAAGVKGAATLAGSARAIGAAAKLRGGAEALSMGLRGFRSVPLAVADKFTAILGKNAAYKAAMEAFHGVSPVLEHAVESGIHLGTASAVSSLKDGWDETIKSGFSGFIFGSAFAGVGNIPWLKESTTANTFIKAAAGSMIQGLPATIEGAPVPILIEQYLTGAYFGGVAQNATRHQSLKFWTSVPKEANRLGIETAPGFNKLPPEQQQDLIAFRDKVYDPEQAHAIIYNFLKHLPGGDKLSRQWRMQFAKPGDYVQIPEEQVVGKIVSKDPKAFTITVEAEGTGKIHVVDAGQVSFKLPEVLMSKEDTASTEAAINSTEQIDFETARVEKGNRFKTVLEKVLGRRYINDEMMMAHLENTDAKLAKILIDASENPTKDSWNLFVGEIQALTEGIRGKKLNSRELGELGKWYDERTKSLQSQERYIKSDGTLGKYRVSPSSGRYRDADNNMRSAVVPIKEINVVAGGDPELTFTVRGKVAQKGLRTLKDFNEVEWTERDWSNLLNASKDEGYFFYGGNSEKAMYFFIKNRNLSEAEISRMRKELSEVYPDFAKDFKTAQDMNEKRFGLSNEDHAKIYWNNIRYWEMFNDNKSIGELMDPKKKGYIQNVLNFNKRQQIMFTDLYPLDAQRMKHKTFRYIVVEDYNKMGRTYQDGTPLHKEVSDGAINLRDGFFADMVTSVGNPSDGGFAKAFILSRHPSLGTLLGKFAFHRMGGVMDAEMKRLGIDAIIPLSAAKQYGDRVVHRYDLVDGKLVIEGEPQIYEANVSDIKMSWGIYDDPKQNILKRTIVANQLIKNLTSEQVGPDVRRATLDWLLKRFEGTTDANLLLKKYAEKPDDASLADILENHFDDIGVTQLIKMMKDSQPFREAVRKKILFDEVSYLDDDMMMALANGEELDVKLEEATSVLNYLKAAGADDASSLSKFAKPTVDSMMLRFFIRRISAPRIKSAGKAYMRTYDPELQKTLNLTERNFFLDDGFKEMQILGINAEGRDEWMSLERLYELGKEADQEMVYHGTPRNAETFYDASGNLVIRHGERKYIGEQEIDVGIPGTSFSNFKVARQFAGDGGIVFEIKRSALPGLKDVGPEEQFISGKGELVIPKEAYRTLLSSEVSFAEQIQQRLRSVILRVPMDDISGAQALDFAGFTGRKGNGVLLHGKNMQRLGGADLDIDSAFFYFGMPKELTDALASDAVRKTQETYRENYLYADRVFYRHDPEDLPLFDSPVGMFDPYHRAKIAHEISKGRGSMMGRAVNSRFLIHALYSMSNAQGKPVEMDTWNPNLKYILTPRKDDGLFFRALAQKAINVSADVGSEGGMVDEVTMRAILLHGAFEKIESVNKKTGEIIDLTGNTVVDAKTEKLSDAARRQLSPTLMAFAERHMWSMTEFKRFSDVNSRLYGRNHREGRTWTYREIVDAVQQYPDRFNHPLRRIAEKVAGLDYNDSLLDRFTQAPDTDYAISNTFQRVISKVGKTMFPFLTNPRALNWKTIHQRTKLMREFYDPRKPDEEGNLYRLTGARELARNRKMWGIFINRMAQIHGKRNVEEFELDYFAPKLTERAQRENLGVKEIKDLRKYYSFRNEDKRVRFIHEVMKESDDFISGRLADLASLKSVERYYNTSGLTPEQAQELMAEVGKVKTTYNKYWKQRREEGSINDTPGSYDAIVEEFNKVKRQASYMALNLRQKGQETSPGAVVDFVESAFLSTFSSAEIKDGTRFSRLGVEMVSDHIIREFADRYSKAFSMYTAGGRKITPADFVGTIVRQNKETGVDRKPELIHFGNVVSKKVEETELTPKSKRILDNLLSAVRGRDNFTAEAMLETLRAWYKVPQISDLTKFEVNGLLARLRALNRGTGFFKRVMAGLGVAKDYRNRGIPFKWWHSLQFIETTADEHLRSYLDFYANKVIDDHGNFNLAQPLQHLNPVNGRLENVYADTREPISHFGRLQKMLSRRDSHISNINAFLFGLFNKEMGWAVKGITQPGIGEDHARDLFKAAVLFHEHDGAQRALKEAQADLQGRDPASLRQFEKDRIVERIKRLERNVEVFAARLEAGKERYQQMEGQLYELAGTKTADRLLGREVVNRMKDGLKRISELAYDEFIKVRPEFLESNIVLDKRGFIDYDKSMRGSMRKFLEEGVLNPKVDKLTYDESQFLLWMDTIRREANDRAKELVLPTAKEIAELRYGSIKDAADFFPEIRRLEQSQKRQYLFHYMTAMENAERIDQLAAEFAKDRTASQAIARARHDINGKINNVEMAARIQRYFGYDLQREEFGHEADIRTKVYGKTRYDQHFNDVLLAAGKLTPQEYLTRLLEDQNPLRQTGRQPGYWMHSDFTVEALKREIDNEKANVGKELTPGTAEYDKRIKSIDDSYEQILAEDRNADGFMSMSAVKEIMDGIGGDNKRRIAAIKHLDELGSGRYVANAMQRKNNLGGYSYDINVIPSYFEKLVSASQNNLAAFQAKRIMESFEKVQKDGTKLLGEYNDTWSKWMRIYVRDGMGYPSIFSDEILKDPTLKLKQTPYYWLSDHSAFVTLTKAGKVAQRLLGFDRLSGAQMAALRVRLGHNPTAQEVKDTIDQRWELFKNSDEGKEFLAKKLKSFSTLEARYEMATLLFHSKTAVANILGGSVNNWVWTGGRFMWQSWKPSVWKDINPEWTSMDLVYKDVAKWGAVEDFILYEGSILSRRLDTRWNAFFEDAVKKIKKDPQLEDASLFKLASKYGITESFMRTSAFFMTKSERLLRTHAFLSGYLQARSSFEPLNRLPYDSPYLIEMGKKSIEMTQFLYSNVNRPAFARTNLGKVYSRFKLWAWSSVRFQRSVFDNARFAGHRPGTVESERLQRLMTANLFAIGLASLLPYSIFDNQLPAPLSYFQNLADWAFGNKRERQRAFYAANIGLPTAIAPLAEFFPPITRIGRGLYDLPDTFSLIWGGEAERIGAFTTYSLFPWGRLGKDALRAYENPAIAADWLAGLPLQGLQRLQTSRRKKRR